MAILGLRGTGNLVSGERPESWREGIIHLFPNGDVPLMALAGQSASEPTSDYNFNWWEKLLPSRRFYINNAAGYTSASTSIVVDDGAGGSASFQVKTGSVLMNERTFEKFLVTADPTTDTLTVARGKGTTAAAAMQDNDTVLIIGSSYEDGYATRISSVQYDPTQRENYTQIFDDSLQLTRRVMKTQLRTGDKYQEARRETLQLHLMGLEWSALFGEPLDEAGSTSAVRRTFTGGMYYWVSTNVHDAGGTMTYFDLMDFLEQDFRYGSNEILVLAGSTYINTMNKLAKLEMTLNAVPKEDSFGMNIKEIVSPFGTLYLAQHPLLSDNPSFRGWAFGVDMKYFKVRTLDDTQLIEHTEENYSKRREDEFYSDIGFEVQMEKTHFIHKNVTGAA